MRLSRIRWRCFGMADEAQMRERAAFKRWLERDGATVAAWMLGWEVHR